MSLIRPTKAIVLAAGRGKRLGALTDQLPKPLLSVAGEPLLTRLLRGLKLAGIRDVHLVVGYLGGKIHQLYPDGWNERIGMQIQHSSQTVLDGTGGALLMARDWTQEPVFVCFGDVLLDPPAHYPNIADMFERERPDAVVAANVVDDPYQGAAIYVGENGRIQRVVEKPPKGTSQTRLNQAGCFIFTPDIFQSLTQVHPSACGEIELTAAISMMIQDGKRMLTYQVPQEEWLEIGTPELLKETDRVIRERMLAHSR